MTIKEADAIGSLSIASAALLLLKGEQTIKVLSGKAAADFPSLLSPGSFFSLPLHLSLPFFFFPFHHHHPPLFFLFFFFVILSHLP